MKLAAGTLAEYTAGGMIRIAHYETVLMLLLQAQAPTEAGHVVTLYHVLSTFYYMACFSLFKSLLSASCLLLPICPADHDSATGSKSELISRAQYAYAAQHKPQRAKLQSC